MMMELPAGINSCEIVTGMDPETIRQTFKNLNADEILAFEVTDDSECYSVLEQAFDKTWKWGFRRDGNWLWTRNEISNSDIELVDLPLEYYVDMLNNHEPFSYLRYSDGEWKGTLDTLFHIGKLETFTPSFREDLRRTLIEYHEDPHYIMALRTPSRSALITNQWGLVGQWGHIVAFLKEHNLTNIRWTDVSPFHGASDRGELWPVIQALRKTNTIIIAGPAFSSLTESVLPNAIHLSIPGERCYSKVDEIASAILAQQLPAVLLFSAGPTTEILIHRLYPIIGKHSTMIDIGSVWCPYVGIPKLGYHWRMTQKIIQRNLGIGLYQGEEQRCQDSLTGKMSPLYGEVDSSSLSPGSRFKRGDMHTKFDIKSDLEFYCYLKAYLPDGYEILAEPQKSYCSEWNFNYTVYRGGQPFREYVGDFREIEPGHLVREARLLLANIRGRHNANRK